MENNIDFFESTSIRLIDNELYANRAQITELYQVPDSTLSDVIKQLKIDNLIHGQYIEYQDIPGNRKDLKNRKIEVFNLESVIAIGLRLRSDKAIKFQRWAIWQLKEIILKQKDEIRQAQLMVSIAWNHLDAKELYKRQNYVPD